LIFSIVGDDVYIGGSTNEWPDLGYKIVYWKNGVPVIVTDRTENYFNFSIVIRRNDIYVAAVKSTNTARTAKYFKNGMEAVLKDASASSYELSPFVTDSFPLNVIASIVWRIWVISPTTSSLYLTLDEYSFPSMVREISVMSLLSVLFLRLQT